jgi:hypothetical protein
MVNDLFLRRPLRIAGGVGRSHHIRNGDDGGRFPGQVAIDLAVARYAEQAAPVFMARDDEARPTAAERGQRIDLSRRAVGVNNVGAEVAREPSQARRCHSAAAQLSDGDAAAFQLRLPIWGPFK